MSAQSTTLDSLERVTFEEGQILFNKGDASYYFYIIEEGFVEVFLPAKDSQNEVSLAMIQPGEAVGEFALIMSKPRSASARATSDCTAIKVSEAGYKSLLEDLPSWARSILQNTIARLIRIELQRSSP